ncbi:MAG: tetratricopeptide repeat protein [Pseudomonadota bacterium]|nr:tetratricopeptide repeat protein [Pseudomonadota bacterium]
MAVLVLSTACTVPTRAPESTASAQEAAAPRGESEAMMAAQNAMRDGDCRGATDSYLAAAGFSEDPQVAMRAAQLALTCDQLPAATAAADRWRALSPYSGEAALTTALVAMKRYDVDAARAGLLEWRESGSSGNQDPLTFAQALAEEADATLLWRLFSEVLVGDDPSFEVLLAQARLAMSAYNMGAAIEAATRASALAPELVEPQVIVLRALSLLGEHTAAMAGAVRLPPEQLQGENAFLLADLLQSAGRNADAETELQRLAANPETKATAEGRLIAMAMRQGKLQVVEQMLASMLGERADSALGVLYLAELAERRGDPARAVQAYGLLAGSPLELSARTSAARLMLREGAGADGLRLLDEFADANPDRELETGLARAHLQVEAKDLKGALATLDSLTKRFPDHPDVEYTRATVLESGGRTRDALTQFDRALKRRPEDPQLLNAYGYTLADHSQRLNDAEAMIRKALEVSPDNPAIQDSLGWLLFRRGRTNEALKMLERAWQNTADAEIGAHFGEVLWKSGDESQALYVWQQALNGSPDHKGVRATMARLTGEDDSR